MKGVIQAYELFVLLMGIALGFMLYVRVDSIQYMSRLILNQSLHFYEQFYLSVNFALKQLYNYILYIFVLFLLFLLTK